MARVIVTDLADADTAKMLTEIASDADYPVALKHNARLECLTKGLPTIPRVARRAPSSGRISVLASCFPTL
jgi:hypothetical protein